MEQSIELIKLTKKRQDLEELIDCILSISVQNDSCFIDDYVHLLTDLVEKCEHIKVAWDVISKTMVIQIIVRCMKAFFEYSSITKEHDNESYFGVMELIGSLFNVGLF